MDNQTLKDGEFHPASDLVMDWLLGMQATPDYFMAKEALYSSSLSGNRMADIVIGTLERLEKGEPVGERYILGAMLIIKGLLESWREKK